MCLLGIFGIDYKVEIASKLVVEIDLKVEIEVTRCGLKLDLAFLAVEKKPMGPKLLGSRLVEAT